MKILDSIQHTVVLNTGKSGRVKEKAQQKGTEEKAMNEKNILIVRCGEVALKGMNKPYFERMLVDRIKNNLKSFQGVDVKRSEGLIFVRADKELDIDAIIKEISKVFGVASISKAVEAPSDMDAIGEEAVKYMLDLIEKRGIHTFKVEGKRADKTFPVKSPEIGRIIGAKVLIGCKVLKVDVHNPDVLLHVDVRHDRSYIYEGKIPGFGGLPLGTNGKGLTLLSGGIDSPVATWMMAKRGMLIEAVHFHSYPYTSQRAQEKVEDLARIVSTYCGRFKMHVINLLPIQEAIVTKLSGRGNNDPGAPLHDAYCRKNRKRHRLYDADYGRKSGTGCKPDSGSVVNNEGLCMRPLIAMDKVDIMAKAEEIGTFETSIQPYEDCCTVFLPKHPTTKPKLERILESESKLDVEALIEAAVQSQEIVNIMPQ